MEFYNFSIHQMRKVKNFDWYKNQYFLLGKYQLLLIAQKSHLYYIFLLAIDIKIFVIVNYYLSLLQLLYIYIYIGIYLFKSHHVLLVFDKYPNKR